jgi:hypothetical protein
MLQLPDSAGLYFAFVGRESSGRPNAILEVSGEAPHLRAVLRHLSNCTHPLGPKGEIDGDTAGVALGPPIPWPSYSS